MSYLLIFVFLFFSGRSFADVSILALDFNQTSESDALAALTANCSNVKIIAPIGRRAGPVPENVDSGGVIGSPYQKILGLCQQEEFSADIVTFSGHYASSWAGDIGRLTLAELEALSCHPACRRTFGQVKHGMIFSCNTLLGNPKRDESSERYVERLLREHDDEFDFNTIIAAGMDMYTSEGGATNASRMQNIFPNAQTLLGFAGGAPLGRSEGGRSEWGLIEMLSQFSKTHTQGNICDALELLAKNGGSQFNQSIVENWVQAMNRVDAIGQHAVGLCRNCSLQGPSGDQFSSVLYSELYCELQSYSLEKLQLAITKVAASEELVKKYFAKLGSALERVCAGQKNCPFFKGLSHEQQARIIEIARARLKIAPLLIHQFDPYRVLKVVGEKVELNEEFKLFVQQFLENPEEVNRDLFRETIQRVPREIFSVMANPLYRKFKNTNDLQLRNDLRDAFFESKFFFQSTIFHKNIVSSAQYSPSQKRIVTVSLDGSSQVIEVEGGIFLQSQKLTHAGFINDVALSSDDRYIVTASDDGMAQVFEMGNRGPEEIGQLHFGHPVSMAHFSPDGSKVLAISQSGILQIAKLGSGKMRVIGTFGPGQEMVSAKFSRDGQILTTLSEDGKIDAYKMRSGRFKLFQSIKTKIDVSIGEFSENATKLLIVPKSDKTKALIFEIHRKKVKAVGEIRHSREILSAQFSNNQQKVATSSRDNSCAVSIFKGGKMVTLGKIEHQSVVYACHFSPSGKKVVSASADGTSRVFKSSGDEFKELALVRHRGQVYSAIFSTDERFVLTASGDGTSEVLTLDKE